MHSPVVFGDGNVFPVGFEFFPDHVSEEAPFEGEVQAHHLLEVLALVLQQCLQTPAHKR